MRDKKWDMWRKMKNEDGEESIKYESQKFILASNLNENVTKWKSNLENPSQGGGLPCDKNGGIFKFEQKTMLKSEF